MKMNNEQAIEVLKRIKFEKEDLMKRLEIIESSKTIFGQMIQAIDLSIESLEDKNKMSERLARYLTGFIYDDLSLPSVEAEIIEQKIINGKFEEVEDFIKSRKDYLADKE